MPRYIRNTAILVKIEPTSGIDAVPTGGANAILVSDVTTNPLNATNVDRALLRPFFGGSEQLVGTAYKEASFSVEIAGSGAAGTAPAFGPLLRACGFAEVVTASNRVEYTPIMRMVPAQMTDIVTQLAGGQNPFLIMIQQGGQMKDSFGGIGPMFRNLAGAITPTGVAMTAGASAAAALVAGFAMGRKEAGEFEKSLAMTGNVAGITAGQLTDMAGRVAQSVDGTKSSAADALNQVAASGKIASTEFETVSAAAVAMKDATGQAIKDTVAQMVALGEDPVKASVKLNEQYHYLTDSVYLQIRALEEQGRKDEAAALAQRTFANALQDRSAKVRENLGALESAWDSVGRAAKGAWDFMLNLGRAATLVMHDFEKCRLKAYPDPATGGAPWTIGWGDTENVRPGMVITQEEADARFERRLARDFEPAVRAAVKVDLTQRQFDALVSIVYNVGPGQPDRDGIIRLKSGEPSTLLRKLNAGDMPGAADAFLSWSRGGAKVLLGLKRRRVAERELFLGRGGAEAAAIGWAVQS